MSGNGRRQGFMVDSVHTAAPSPQKNRSLAAQLKPPSSVSCIARAEVLFSAFM